MVYPLADNWQSLLCIFWKFSLRWRKLRQLRSCIAFEKRYHRSSHINHMSCIKGKSVINTNQGEVVNTQKDYKWSYTGRECYIRCYNQRRLLIPILTDLYLPMEYCIKIISDLLWWEWDTGSSLLFLRWPKLYQLWSWEGHTKYAIGNSPQYLRSQDPAKTEEDRTNMKKREGKVR